MAEESDIGKGKRKTDVQDDPVVRRLANFNSQMQALQKQVDELTQRVNSSYYRDNQETSAAFSRLQAGLDVLADTLTVQSSALERALKRPQVVMPPSDPMTKDWQEGQGMFKQTRDVRWRDHERSLHDAAYLASLTREKTYMCPCGKHMGIRLVDETKRENWDPTSRFPDPGIIEENLCPANFWLTLSRLAYADHRLAEFHQKTPWEAFLKEYEFPLLET